MPIPEINPRSRWEPTNHPPNYKRGHNRDRFMLFLGVIIRARATAPPLYLNQLVELWEEHLDELNANRPNTPHHRKVMARDSVKDEVCWHLDAMRKAGVLREI